MKKNKFNKLIAIILMISFIVSFSKIGVQSFSGVESKDNVSINRIHNTVETQYNKVVLVYMVGSDLESESELGVLDIKEMINAKFGKNNLVILETGGAKKWHKLDGVKFKNNKLQRYMIKDGKITLLEELEEQSMGEAKTLKSFVQYVKKNYSAKNYSLVLWSHGAGPVEGFGTDENYDFDSLNLEEMNEALKDTIKFENIIFDACLMGNLETAFVLSKYGKFMMSSAELSPGEGLNYTKFLEKLLNKKMSEFTLLDLQDVTDGLHDTISVIDLSKTNKLMQVYSSVLINTKSNEIHEAAKEALAYGVDENGDGFDLFDLGNIFKKLKIDENVLNDVVLSKYNSESYKESSGLSVYLPIKDGSYLVEAAKETLDDVNLPNNYLSKIKSLANLANPNIELNSPEISYEDFFEGDYDMNEIYIDEDFDEENEDYFDYDDGLIEIYEDEDHYEEEYNFFDVILEYFGL